MFCTTSLRELLRRGGAPLAIVAATAILVTGCGGSGGQGGSSTTSVTPSPAASKGVAVSAAEFSFTPSSLTASAGQVNIKLTNGGAVEHNFTIDAPHVAITALPGKTGEATVAMTPGTYKFYCSVPGHRESGMEGTLIVS